MRIEAASRHHLSVYPAYFHACQSDGCEHYVTVRGSATVFFQRVLDYATGEHLPPGYVASQTWFALDDYGQILGAIRLRLGTTPYIHDICGHIGYEVLPAARLQGVAGKLLDFIRRQAPVQLDDGWLITCDADNIASQRVIERAEGVLLDIRQQGRAQALLHRYFVANKSAAR